MQEKLHQAELRATRAEARQSKEAELREEISALKLRLEHWETAANQVGVESPASVADKLREAQNECLILSEKVGEKESSIRILKGVHPVKTCCPNQVARIYSKIEAGKVSAATVVVTWHLSEYVFMHAPVH